MPHRLQGSVAAIRTPAPESNAAPDGACQWLNRQFDGLNDTERRQIDAMLDGSRINAFQVINLKRLKNNPEDFRAAKATCVERNLPFYLRAVLDGQAEFIPVDPHEFDDIESLVRAHRLPESTSFPVAIHILELIRKFGNVDLPAWKRALPPPAAGSNGRSQSDSSHGHSRISSKPTGPHAAGH